MKSKLNNKQILVVEDDRDIGHLIEINLKDLGCKVTLSRTGEEAEQQLSSHAFDLIILDRMLPDTDGLEICRELRATQAFMPILMLTAKDSELDRVVGLEVGADDYLTKPFSIKELQARVKAQLRRAEMQNHQPPEENKILIFDNLQILLAERQVKINKKSIDLTQTEFDLLAFLAKHPGKVFNRSELLDNVWDYQHRGYEHTVNSHINRLRNKIETDPSHPKFVYTVWGVGYRFANQ